jgi:hypothetical protein
MKCEKCNSEMIGFKEKSVQGVKCPNCGWSILTSYINEINTDNTVYTISISKVKKVNISQIKLIAKLVNVNYLQAKEILLSGKTKIYEAKAPKIKKMIDDLEKEEISYTVFPEFKY